MAMSKDELRALYPMLASEERHWEIYDEVDARIVGIFYYEDEALAYLEWRNSVSDDLIQGTIVNKVDQEDPADLQPYDNRVDPQEAEMLLNALKEAAKGVAHSE